jgi:hypothetical protein
MFRPVPVRGVLRSMRSEDVPRFFEATASCSCAAGSPTFGACGGASGAGGGGGGNGGGGAAGVGDFIFGLPMGLSL